MSEKAREKAYAESKADILVCLAKVLDEAKRSLFARDSRRLRQAREAAGADLAAGLALLEGAAKNEKSQHLRRLAAAAEGLLQRMQAVLKADTPLTDQAAAQVSEIITLVRDAARDVSDMAAAGTSPHFRRYILSNTALVAGKAREWTAGNGQRQAAGTPRSAAYALWLDLVRLLEGIADDLAAIAQDA
jgi:hypothetical protein